MRLFSAFLLSVFAPSVYGLECFPGRSLSCSDGFLTEVSISYQLFEGKDLVYLYYD